MFYFNRKIMNLNKNVINICDLFKLFLSIFQLKNLIEKNSNIFFIKYYLLIAILEVEM